MNVRSFENRDLDQLINLFDAYRVFYRKDSDKVQARHFLSERIQNQESQIFVCELNEQKLIGFVQLYPLFSSTRMKQLWLLNDLFVDPGHRGMGASVQLIERCKQLVQDSGACGLFLETEKSNLVGNSLYPKTGFRLNEGSNFYEWSV